MFAGHGMILNGGQVVLTNNYDPKCKFYEFILVEMRIRLCSKNLTNVYFIALFACCREIYNEAKTKKGIASPLAKNCGVHKDCCLFSLHDVFDPTFDDEENFEAQADQNFTLLFGCDPQQGVVADTKFIEAFIKHLKNSFESKTGTLRIPECLGFIEQSKVSF